MVGLEISAKLIEIREKISFLGSHLQNKGAVKAHLGDIEIILEYVRLGRLIQVEQLEREFGEGIYFQKLLNGKNLKKKFGNEVFMSSLVPRFTLTLKDLKTKIRMNLKN